MKVRRSLLKQTVTVQTYSGEGATGPVYATAVSVPCRIDQKRRLVRTLSGDEAISEATLIVHPDDEARFVAESLITIGAAASKVLATKPHTYRGYTVSVEVVCS